MKHVSSVLLCPFFCRIFSFSVLSILRTRSRQFFVWYLNCGLPLPTSVLSCLVTGYDLASSAYFLSTNDYAPMSLIFGVFAGRLLTYSLFSVVQLPIDFLTVSHSYSMMVRLPFHFSLFAMRSVPCKSREGCK